MKRLMLCGFFLLFAMNGLGQSRQDTLRGSNGRGRDWWDVQKYDLQIKIDTAAGSISGSCRITFRVAGPPRDSMQIDLQAGMQLKEPGYHNFDGQRIPLYKQEREGNVYWLIKPAGSYRPGTEYELSLEFFGKPATAVNPPWDGGFIWTRDSAGNPWLAVACQGLGASSWWPCKDYQGDEPDRGVTFWLDRSDPYRLISNGRFFDGDTILVEDPVTGDREKRWSEEVTSWKVRNPINTYNTTFYIGDYAHWHDTLHGEKGVLDLDFHPLRYNEAKARKHWAVTKDMLRCFEHWMGPYPFYEDGYKLVEAPFLGMEHQSAVAYGNLYRMGYRGGDRSGTGVGLSFDFIIVHESGHEWFGNNITATDVADNWLHEGFTTYTEALFTEWIKGKEAAFTYTTGQWRHIKNDRPIIGAYGVHDDGSGDKYDKGSAILHMIRMMMHDDEKFRQLLRGLNRDFYHKTVTSKEVEEYISSAVGRDLKPFFDQYLRRRFPAGVHAKLERNKVTLTLQSTEEALKIPIYDERGRFVCELSRDPVTVRRKQLKALRNYYFLYTKEPVWLQW